VKQLKDVTDGSATVEINGIHHSLAELGRELVVESVGDSIAYLTDFLLNEPAMDRLQPVLRGCKTVICEAQYRHADLELARRNFHMTTVLAATLAKRAQIGELILFHLSDRYNPHDWIEMLHEARAIFPSTNFPSHWRFEE
jgi:ribonuclease Z